MAEEENQNDVTDIRLFRKSKPKPVVTKIIEPVVTKVIEPVLLSEKIDSEEYSMNFPHKGMCYIFSHEKFLKSSERKGASVDARRVLCLFTKLGFEDIKIFFDKEVKFVTETLKEAGKADHSKNSCFVCCIMTHGNSGVLQAYDGVYPTESVYAPFVGDACPSLVGKPKMFFIQACQGNKTDSGVEVVFNESTDDISGFKISSHADFLIMYSTVPGFYSFRNEREGSWFIQALCDVLEEHAKNKDLLKMLTIVNRKVAVEFESYNPDEPILHEKKQVPWITSSLTRNVRFL